MSVPSKDHAEHLRTVHFALLAACFALLVLTLSEAPDEVRTAKMQIDEVLELARAWPSPEMHNQANEEVAQALQVRKSEFASALWPVSPELLRESPEHLRQAAPEILSDQTVEITSPELPIIPRPLSPPLRLNFNRPNWIVENQSLWAGWWKSLVFDGGLFKIPSEPRSVRQFGQLWDALAERLTVHIPVRLSERLYTIYRPTSEMPGNPETREWTWRLSGATAVASNSVGLTLRKLAEMRLPAIRSSDIPGVPEFVYVAEVGSFGSEGLFRGPTLIVIPVTDAVKVPWVLDGQGILIRSSPASTSWRRGSFRESFRELATITEDYGDLQLEDARNILAGEAERRKERLEIFGVRLPSEDSILWGRLIVVGIQLYFWLHLKAFAKRVADPITLGSDVAWIGLYDGLWAGLAFLASAYVLPVLVVALLGVQGVGLKIAWGTSIWNVPALRAHFEAGAMLLVSAVLAVASCCCWPGPAMRACFSRLASVVQRYVSRRRVR